MNECPANQEEMPANCSGTREKKSRHQKIRSEGKESHFDEIVASDPEIISHRILRKRPSDDLTRNHPSCVQEDPPMVCVNVVSFIAGSFHLRSWRMVPDSIWASLPILGDSTSCLPAETQLLTREPSSFVSYALLLTP